MSRWNGATVATRAAAGLCLALACAGCSKATDTAPSSSGAPVTEIIVGTLEIGGVNAYPFNVALSGTVSATLASVTAGTPRIPVAVPLVLGLGTVDGINCAITASSTVRAALTAQVSTSMTTGNRCVQISDPGTLTGPVDFAVRVVHP